MKYLVVLTDGMADYPVPELDNQTPLEVSNKPYMDYLAQQGKVGLAQTIPPGFPPGSDVANLAVLGYDPRQYYTGRSPLEAASMGINLAPTDIAFRCNLVTLSNSESYENKVMVDYSAGEITTEEAEILMKDLASQLNSEAINFYPGISYRHLMVWQEGNLDFKLTPPHDISDQRIKDALPAGDGSELLLDLMQQSQKILTQHPVNQKRIENGLNPANSIWLWGQGKAPSLTPFTQKYDLTGAVISAVDLAKGLGICAGLKVINVPGVTGTIHTNFAGKAAATLQAFREGIDLVYLHIEAPDEAGHQGDVQTKIQAIEKIDHEVLAPLLAELPKICDDFRILLMPDHATPLVLKTHTSDPVPFIIYQHQKAQSTDDLKSFTEANAAKTKLLFPAGHTLMDYFINN